MRLHHLEIEAFGPFATPVQVDFDELSEAGLFLLSGATGAGKSSVLDAVCFALYGDVPGDRSTAKRLRCDTAAPSAQPRVVLEATLSGRRFRLVRSPAWERPKRRGEGTTTQQSSVTISERVGDAWQPLSSRIDETGDLVTRLVGMNLAQFTQVAMLPQGRFQAFLRAKSEERHALLQRLFRTGRFEQVERWLRDRRLALARDHDAAHQRAADLVSRVSEAADLPLPAAWDVHDLSPVVDDEALRGWAAALLDDARVAREAAAEQSTRAAADEVAVRAALDEARSLRDRRVRHDAARAELASLVASSARHADDQRRLDAAQRASVVLPLHRHATAAVQAAAARRREADAARAAAVARLGARPHDPADLVDLATAADAAGRAAAVVHALQPRAAGLGRATAELGALAARRSRLDGERATARVEHAELPERVARLRTAVGHAREAVLRVEVLTASVQVVRVRLDAHALAARLRVEVQEARGEWLDAREQTLLLKERLVDLQHARIEGMAAELAGQLVVGCSCPVCGSPEHPLLAASSPGAPDAGAERSARVAVDNAAIVELAFDSKVRDLDTSLATALARAGDTAPTELARELDGLEAEHADAGAVAAGLPGLVAELDDAERSRADLEVRLADLATDLARADAEHAALDAEVGRLRREVASLLDGSGHDDLDALLRHHRSVERLCRDALAQDGAAEGAEAARQEAVGAARAAAAEAGFATPDTAAGAALPPRDLRDLADAVVTHERRLAAVRAVLAEPQAEVTGELPDVDALDRQHGAALASRDAAAVEQRLWLTREQRLTGLLGELDVVLASWLPLRADLAVATRLSSFVEGKSVDNALRMRLSAYVLAYRLSQVVAAANERLSRMSDQRYSLEHTGRRGAGETRGGLSLLVRDDWSGEARDPATLSGGETFVVSLALALGLADVITQEAGGAALDTLFVDEGFGSLDADTLDDVMDTLDSLRDGGRVVGVVSHVAEMRDRIPTQLVVTKSRSGSSVAVRR